MDIHRTDFAKLKRRRQIIHGVIAVAVVSGLLAWVSTLDPAMQTIRLGDLVAKATDLLPPPDEGKRDTRRQHVARAIENLCKEKDGEISKAGNVIVLYQ